MTNTAFAIPIATGRDSADTPFLTVLSGMAPVLFVGVTVDEEL